MTYQLSADLLCSVLVSKTTLCAEAVVCVMMRNERMVFIGEAVKEAFVFAVLHYVNTVCRDGRRPRTAVTKQLFVNYQLDIWCGYRLYKLLSLRAGA